MSKGPYAELAAAVLYQACKDAAEAKKDELRFEALGWLVTEGMQLAEWLDADTRLDAWLREQGISVAGGYPV